jgi:hypothetical protein
MQKGISMRETKAKGEREEVEEFEDVQVRLHGTGDGDGLRRCCTARAQPSDNARFTGYNLDFCRIWKGA